MGRRLRVPISTARAKLFQLTDLVRNADEDTVVLLEQRGTVGGVALVREARLAYLEARVAALDTRAPEPFTLAGSLASALDDDALEQALTTIRREWTPARQPSPRRRLAAAPRRRSR